MTDESERENYIETTLKHIDAVRRELRYNIIPKLEDRAERHDASKLYDPEMAGFIAMHREQALTTLTYGSPEYGVMMRRHKPIIAKHYAANDHHPEHHREGVWNMDLLMTIEMLVDWYASSQRVANGDFEVSLFQNKERFELSEQLFVMLWNTGVNLGFIADDTTERLADAHERCLERGLCKEA